MRSKQLLLGSSLVVGILLLIAVPGFSQVQAAQSRIPQQVVINGQTVNAVHVLAASGGFQAYTCRNPQQYTTVDGSSQGWACYDQSTGVWLLNALPPAQAQQTQPQVQQPPPPPPAPQPQVQQPTVIYAQPAPAVIYQQPATIIYTSPGYPVPPVVIAPAYPPSVVLGTAAIDAAGRIISSALIGYRYPRVYYGGRGWRRW